MVDLLLNQRRDFAGFGVASALQFGEDQLTVQADFKPSTIGGDKRDGLDLRFKQPQEFSEQAHGPRSVASNCAVDDFYLEHGLLVADRMG